MPAPIATELQQNTAKRPTITLPKGISADVVSQISDLKHEPEWMKELRLKAYEHFKERKMPTWGADLSEIDFDDIHYYISAGEQSHDWEDVPTDIKDTFDALGIPEHEKKFLAGVSTQYESEVMYHSLHQQYQDAGLIFESIDMGLQKYPELFKQYFGKLIPYGDNKFAALNTAVWSGGSFVYVPKGVKITLPIETYFRINAESVGQFERTLIIADEDSEIHYIEGCTAPQYSSQSLHAAVVEIFALKNATVRYTTIQNWSHNIYNLVTKRAMAHENAKVYWTDVNIGSKVTMKYPAVILKGDNSHGEMLSMAVADSNQELDTGAKMIHVGKQTSSIIDSRTISIGSGKATYRGISEIKGGATNSRARVSCDGLLIDENSKSYAYPTNILGNSTSQIEHEASVSKISESQKQYLMSRGLDEQQAIQMIVSGYATPILDFLPIEYSVELEKILYMLTQRHGKGHQKTKT